MSAEKTIILLTGPPGVGKTTLIINIYEHLKNGSNIQMSGFYTEEVRENKGPRIGFDVISLCGKRSILARDTPKDGLRRPKIGKYHVYLSDFEALILPLLQSSTNQQLLIIDEIGKMELLSRKFEAAISEKLGKIPILATIPSRTNHTIPIVELLKKSSDSKLFEITKFNRNVIQNEIIESIQKLIK